MLIAYRDYIADATLVDTGGSFPFEANAPLSNAQDRRLAVVARRTTNGIVSVDATFAEARTIGIVGILAHNLPREFQLLIIMQGASGPLYTFQSSSIWVPPTDSQFPRNLYLITEAAVEGVTSINYDLRKTPAGGTFDEPIEFGRLWAGPVWEPEGRTAQRDFHMHTRDESVVTRSIGQQVYVDYKPRYRQLACAIPYLTEAEAIGTEDGETQNLQDIAFEVGRGGEVIVIPSTHSNQIIHRFGVYGHFLEPPVVHYLDANRQKGRLFTTEFDVVETL